MRNHGSTTRALLAVAVGLAIVFSGYGAGLAEENLTRFTATQLAPESSYDLAATWGLTSEKVSVIVKLDEPSLASYTGGVAGLAPTSPQATGSSRLDVRSAASQAYLGHLARTQAAVESAARSAAPDARITQHFDVVLNGLAVVVPANQVEALRKIRGVISVERDEVLQVDTDRSPQFLQADIVWRYLGGQSKAGQGVIVGVLDTGIWPEHPSLSDPDPAGDPYPAPPPPLSGTRQCEFSGGSNPGPAFTCNNKLIGADRFMATYDAVRGLLPTEYTTARDDNGHGTHTATTAAGNGGVAAEIFDVARGTVSGIAPRAHVIMYKVCGDAGCFQSDSVAAIQKAIQDGVNVINFSISGGANPYSDAVELAFLDAYNAGVFVAASAGNSGPAANTTDHRGPWVTTIAASTTDRAFTSTATIRASNGDSIQVTGGSITDGITSRSLVLPPAGRELCGSVSGVNPFPAGTFHGEIVVCQRGITGRVEKGFNVFTGGGGGMILYNPTLQGTFTDNHWLPAIHIENDAGAQLLAFIGSHSGVTASWPRGEKSSTQGDVMAAFSSRGGAAQSIGVSKPDVTAPGVQILAGQTPTPATILGGPPGELFQTLQGTSMSSPHAAGLAALVKNLYPTWTPGQIKSAIMTTAKRNVVKEDGTTPADAFDDGSGRIDPPRAADPQITFSDTGANYVALQNQLWNANYPSVFVPNMPGIITVRRTAHSELTTPSEWSLRVVGEERDFVVTVQPTIHVPAGGDATFEITMDARAVPLGQVRFANLELRNGTRILHIPLTIVRNQSVLPLTKTCAVATIAIGGTTTCRISATNTTFNTANVNITDNVPDNLQVVSGSVTGATQVGNTLTFTGTLQGVQPPNVTIAPGSSPAGGYLPLAAFGIGPIGGMGDETLVNFNVPAFTYAGTTYTRIGVVSDGYVVVGGGTAADIDFINQNLPDPARPNNVLAPWWTDLNPGTGGAVRIGTLTDGADTWIVVDFDAVREFSQNRRDSFEIWIGVNGDAHPAEDITYAFGTLQGNGDGGFLTVGAENIFGNRGQNRYLDGTGTIPVNGTELRVTGTPGAPGETHNIDFTVLGVKRGSWTNYVLMTGDLFQGVAVGSFSGTVTK